MLALLLINTCYNLGSLSLFLTLPKNTFFRKLCFWPSLPIYPLKNLDYIISRSLTTLPPLFYKSKPSQFIQLGDMSGILTNYVAGQRRHFKMGLGEDTIIPLQNVKDKGIGLNYQLKHPWWLCLRGVLHLGFANLSQRRLSISSQWLPEVIFHKVPTF